MKVYESDLDYLEKNSNKIAKSDLAVNDLVLVHTQQSVYSIRVLENDYYVVSGGWFDRTDMSPMRTTIVGCTWGGSAIATDLVAACGQYVEFGNRVRTSKVRKICVIPSGRKN